ncbi:Fe(3+)-hydroxamate ABC transporter permease FhuB [Rhodanobacter aciditrophus]|uniref:Fe(3+)-hydroxamate ABC transporter permease FhuB n=1 Tax=Rhodanobacter aciditrophus TaxID=1623218 RepID=A0ABW4B5S2_9GAMM
MERQITKVSIPLMVCALIACILLGTNLPFNQQWHLITQSTSPESFADFSYLFGHLPRLTMALIVGATFGLVGSLMQQLTQNPLTSPLTLGTSSGAWLALIILNVWFTQWVGDYAVYAAMAGSFAAFFLILAIVGIENMTGLPVVVAGMVVNILLGAIATGIMLLNEQFAQNIFMWGAGDLAQNGWEDILWLLPKLLLIIPLLIFAPRILMLMRLGQDNATARGLAVLPTFLALIGASIWLTSSTITIVGVIGFIGLIAPNCARAMGARTPRQELLASMVLGAIFLLLTDRAAFFLSQMTSTVIASGVTTALVGAPALIWFCRRKLRAQDSLALILPKGKSNLSPFTLPILGAAFLLGLILTTTIQLDSGIWTWQLPSEYQWMVRWPRMLSAIAAGMGLAIAGVLLQRLIYNPLASPDILGVSAGATFAIVVTTLAFGSSALSTHWTTAIVGSLSVLGLLLLLGKRHQFAPSSLILTGIAVTALLDAAIQFFLSRGTSDSYRILLWLAGSTYRVSPSQSVLLAVSMGVMSFGALLCSRWLTQLSIGRGFAAARGVPVQWASLTLLSLVALLCATITATLGPISFIGLIAPHMAIMLGATKARAQIGCAGLLGATLLLWADWFGQVILYPAQIAAGTIVSIVGGLYFILLLLHNRTTRRH